jgi:hypothetical protein
VRFKVLRQEKKNIELCLWKHCISVVLLLMKVVDDASLAQDKTDFSICRME